MIILGTNSIKDTGYDVANSARFNRADGAYMDRTFSSAGNRDKWTYSLWVKKCKNGVEQRLLTTSDNATFDDNIRFNSDDTLTVICNNSVVLKTNRVFRDNSAFYHICVIWDSGNGTSGDRCQLFVNGTRETSFSTASYPSQNQDSFINNNTRHYIGVTNVTANSHFLDGYLTEVVFQNDSADSPVDKFGSFDEDSGIWKPIDVSGLTFGNSGFYLDFKDSSALGDDVSGNGNDFTVNNLTAIDQSTDTCTNNFATLNPLNVPTSNAPTFAEGNLFGESVTGGTSSSAFGGSSTFGLTKGKWYLEAKCGSTGNRDSIGVTGEASTSARTNKSGGTLTNSSYFYQGESGVVFVNTVSTGSFSTFTNNDIIGIALDLDNNKLYFRKNAEAWGNSGDPTSGATGTGAISLASISSTTDGAYFISNGSTAGGGAASAKSVFSYNFGSPPYAISSGNTDGNGYGNFEYAVPSGYYSLNTKNLAEYG